MRLNEQAFVKRAMACERKLYRAARAILGCDADCEDAVQDALIKAWQRLDTLREERYFETWLTRILINECKNLCKKRRLAEVLPETLAALQSPEPELFEALTKLPEKIRLAMVLHYNDGYDVAQVSGILRIPVGTVKWRLHQGRAQLRKMLGEEAFR